MFNYCYKKLFPSTSISTDNEQKQTLQGSPAINNYYRLSTAPIASKEKQLIVADAKPDIVDAETSAIDRKRKAFRALTVGCIITDMPYVAFLAIAIIAAVRYAFSEFGISGEALNILIAVGASILSTMGTLCDMTIANPIETAESLALAKPDEDLKRKLEADDKCTSGTTKSLIVFNQLSANATYIVGATVNALPFAYLSSSIPIQLSIGLPITAFGIAFYNLIMWKRINRHSYEFIHRLFSNSGSMLVNALRSPVKSLEVLIQTVSSAIYRGVTFGYVTDQLLTLVFKKDENDPTNLYSLYVVGALTLYVSFFSRTLNVHAEYFNPKLDQIPAEALQAARVTRGEIFIDSLMALLRGLPASTILFRHGSSNLAINLPIALGTGLTLFSHALYVRYTNRLYQRALTQREGLLVPSDSIVNDSLNAEQLFSLLEDSFKTESLKSKVTIVNALGRIGRSLAFLGFLATLNDTLVQHGVLKLDFYDLLCLHQLWGNTTFENESSFYQESVVENWAYYKAKIYMEKTSPQYGWGAFWKAKSQYSKEYLQKFLPHPQNSGVKIEVVEDEKVDVPISQQPIQQSAMALTHG